MRAAKERYKLDVLRLGLQEKREFDALLDRAADAKFRLEKTAGSLLTALGTLPRAEAVIQHGREGLEWLPEWSLRAMAEDAVAGYAESLLAGIKRRTRGGGSLPVEPEKVLFSTDGTSVKVPFLMWPLHCRTNNKFWTVGEPTERQLGIRASIRRVEVAVWNQDRCLLVYAPG